MINVVIRDQPVIDEAINRLLESTDDVANVDPAFHSGAPDNIHHGRLGPWSSICDA
ncbi:MAG: hypothetical protein ACYTBJ_01300 [Planctomycetota bacterium]